MTLKEKTPAWVNAPLSFFGFGIALTFFFRHIWQYSLANGDEFYFASLKGRATPGTLSMQQVLDFFYYLWAEHTGRTADWFSTSIYFFGFSTGKWITSALTGFSIALIAFSVYKVFCHYTASVSRAVLTSFMALLISVFAVVTPAFYHPAYIANLLVYSAAIANYLVLVAVMTWIWALGLTTDSTRLWIVLTLVAFIIGTTHEQAALAIVTITVGLAFLRRRHIQTSLLLMLPAGAFLGALAMFLSPGLHAKLARAKIDTTLNGSLLEKAKVSLKALDTQFDNLPIYLLLLGCIGLFFVIKFSKKVFDPTKASASGAVLIMALAAAATMSIPLASGTGQIRVFNYPLLFAGIAAASAFYLGMFLWNPKKIALLIPILVTAWMLPNAIGGLWKTLDSQQQNYPVGYVQLLNQIDQCPTQACILEDPVDLPVHHGFSGYGDHEYANTTFMKLWLNE